MEERPAGVGGTPAERAARRAFVGALAHELRAPLTVAMGQAELLAEAGDAFDAATRATMARDVLAAVERLTQALDDLVDIAFAETADGARGGSLALGPLLEEVVGSPAPAAAAVSVRADRRLLARALRALLENGRRPGHGEPRLEVRREDRAVVVDVVDAGPRIAPEHRAAALDRLSRVPGRGGPRPVPLGVTLARVVAETAGGGLEIDDAPEGGCVFRMRLPVVAP